MPVCSNSCPLNQWCYLTISFSVIPFSSLLQSFPASGSFLRSRLFTSDGQSSGVSASASVFLMNIQGWLPLGLSRLISFLSNGLSRVFSSTIWKHQLFSAHLVTLPLFCLVCILDTLSKTKNFKAYSTFREHFHHFDYIAETLMCYLWKENEWRTLYDVVNNVPLVSGFHGMDSI